MKDSYRLIFEKDRLETFNKNWKDLGFKLCTPENFAAAGFYNSNTNVITDTVKCVFCQKELNNWEEDDNPWEEHVRRGTKCPFVKFKRKKQQTVKDFLELQYETKKIIMKNCFEKQKKVLKEKEKTLLKEITELEKLSKKAGKN